MKSPFKHPFWDAYHGYGPSPKCVDETLLVELSKAIRAKQDWKKKSSNDAIMQKWKDEIKSQISDKTKNVDKIINYVLAELKWYKNIEESFEGFLGSGFSLITDEGHVSSDSAINEKLISKLKSETEALYCLFGNELDYHPNSNNQVIDLVHPSLFPLQYGRTPMKTLDGYTVVQFDREISKVKEKVALFGVSEKFQWLPAVVEYKQDSKKFEFVSYINNLHPIKYRDLYSTISEVFSAAIPGLNLSLSRASSEQYIRIPVPPYTDAYEDKYNEKLLSLYDDDNLSETELDEKYEELQENKINYVRDLEITYKEPKTNKIDLNLIKQLKVIVKLANIELTPENPSYKGGSWHVEGTINEDIIATVLFYYEMKNITESNLSFKKATEDPLYEQSDDFYCKYFYDLKDEADLYENSGSIEAKKGRMVIFPNTHQHHVDPFELVDKTKKGFRKILCYFLVDPYNEKVLSTDSVPPQQAEWWEDESLAYLVPSELKNNFEPQTLDEAKKIREQLMSERSLPYSEEDGMTSISRKFSLCEH